MALIQDLGGGLVLRHVAPVFEKRLAESIFTGHTGALKFNFYRSAFRMTFANGKIGAECYAPAHQDDGAYFSQTALSRTFCLHTSNWTTLSAFSPIVGRRTTKQGQ